MVGIYKYANGLQFTGIVAETEEDAKTYLRNKNGYTRDGEFVPYYNEDAIEIKEVIFIKTNKE